MRRFVVRMALVALAILLMAAPVLANSSSYSWEMPYSGRYVNGKNNGVTHSLTAGSLTNSGSLWAYEKPANANPTPQNISIAVWRSNLFTDSLICEVTVTPSTTVNQQTNYSKACGSVSSGTYYLIVQKAVMDGWSHAGQGTLVTQ